MAALPIRRMTLYKHGVGYFERRGAVEGESLRLSFARTAMDDVLKSLVALDLGAGQVLGVDFETPEDRATLLAKGSIHLSDNHSLLDLLRDLRGRSVRLVLEEGGGPRPQRSSFGLSTGGGAPPLEPAQPSPSRATLEGLVIGVDVENEQPMSRPVVTIYQPDERRVRMFFIPEIKHLIVLDDAAAADLTYFLRAAQSEEDRRSATVQLSPGSHDMLIGYIAPAPAWRVSYRMLVEAQGQEPTGALPSAYSVLLQGWGLFDNQLEEDLEGVELTLVAGMPVSFRYRLYEPRTPVRPLVQDEERTVSEPIFFEGASAAEDTDAFYAAPLLLRDPGRMAMGKASAAAAPSGLTLASMTESVQAAAGGEERGALFAYRVAHTVSVARGQSAMVPILSQRLACRRELLYNGLKLPKHPLASLRLKNDTGLTLERGPVTVLEQGDYAGEAVLPFSRVGGELIVPFAVELGISVEEQRNSERRMASINVRDDYLLIQEYDVQHTTYHLTSTLEQRTTVVVEHTLRDGYELTDTREPTERTASLARWEVDCAPHARSVFIAHERCMVSRWEQVRELTLERLRAYLKNRFLDETTEQVLENVLAVYEQIKQAQQRLAMLGKEREQVYAQQRQIQGSLAPLGGEGDEGALRKRYVALLNSAEDRLGALAHEETQLNERSARLEQLAAARLKELEG